MVSHYVGVGQVYDEVTQFLQLNFTSGIHKDPKECRIYKMQDDDQLLFVQNAFIYEVNIDRIVRFWYDENEEKIQEYKYIIMLGLPLKELEKLYSKTKDRLVKKYMEELERVNEDPKFREYLTKEQDEEKIRNTLIMEAKAESEEQTKIEIAKWMISKKMDRKDILEATGLTEKEIHKLSKYPAL